MSTTTSDPAPGVLVPVADPLFTPGERQALAGFLSGYSGLTRDAYTLDLRQGLLHGWVTPVRAADPMVSSASSKVG